MLTRSVRAGPAMALTDRIPLTDLRETIFGFIILSAHSQCPNACGLVLIGIGAIEFACG